MAKPNFPCMIVLKKDFCRIFIPVDPFSWLGFCYENVSFTPWFPWDKQWKPLSGSRLWNTNWMRKNTNQPKDVSFEQQATSPKTNQLLWVVEQTHKTDQDNEYTDKMTNGTPLSNANETRFFTKHFVPAWLLSASLSLCVLIFDVCVCTGSHRFSLVRFINFSFDALQLDGWMLATLSFSK